MQALYNHERNVCPSVKRVTVTVTEAVAYLGFQKGGGHPSLPFFPSSSSFPSPFLLLPLPSFPLLPPFPFYSLPFPFPFPFPCLSTSLPPLPSLPLEVGPLKSS